MKILVTGSAGFIGSHLAEKLVSLGHEVIGVDNFNSYYDVNLKRLNAKHIEAAGVQMIEIDLNDDLKEVLPTDFDYVYHFAAQPGISNTTTLNEYVTNNIFATQNLLDFILYNNKPLKGFFNIATSSIYGIEATLSETEEPKPVSFYGITKLAAEQLVLALQRKGKLNACSLRLYSVYGPRERPEKLYTKLIKSIFEGTSFPIFKGSLTHSRSFTYVGDIVSALVKCMDNMDAINGEIINIGSDKEYTTADGVALVEKVINKKANLKEMPPRDGDQLRTAAIINKANSLLNYNPTTTFEDGIRAQVVWYKKNFVD